MARIEEESTMTGDPSIWTAARKRASSTSWSSSHTPAACQSRRRRQQLMLMPQPISCGSRSQRRPVWRMNRIPVSTARFSSGLRPGFRERRGLERRQQRFCECPKVVVGYRSGHVRRRNNNQVNRNDRELTAPKHHFVRSRRSSRRRIHTI
jgi:hypothetical protein